MKWFLTNVVVGSLLFFNSVYIYAEETVGCAHTVGKGKIKIRGKTGYIEAQKCYSDEVWKAFHSKSPYPKDYDEMVELPQGWHQEVVKVSMGFEYGITNDLSVGFYFPYIMKDMKRQVWSQTGNTIWKHSKESGLEDIWISTKYRILSKAPLWEDGLFLAIGYKPSITSDEKIKNGIGTGAQSFKFVALSHPYFTEKFFLCGDIWYEYRGKIKEIEGFSKSGRELGDRFGYRVLLGYEFLNHKFVVIAGAQGWIALNDKDKEGNKINDSNSYSHGMVLKLRWQPFGDEDLGSLDLVVRIPYMNKTPFAPTFVPFLSGRIKF